MYQESWFHVKIFAGDPNKGEMNTLQIRDFGGDGKMLMSLVAQDVVCLRYYEKVLEEWNIKQWFNT